MRYIGNKAVKCCSMFRDCHVKPKSYWLKFVTTKEKLFFLIVFFPPPKAISEDKYRGKGRSIV